MKCPKCAGSMNELQGLDFSADRCDQCGGIWLKDSDIDVKQHVAAVDSIDQSVEPHNDNRADLNDVRDIQCPSCDVAMIKMIDRTQLSVDYEACPDCRGAFFDAGELKDLSEFTLLERVKLTWDTLKTNLN